MLQTTDQLSSFDQAGNLCFAVKDRESTLAKINLMS
jgi:hypothetical protein